ncbi:unknown [Bacteroides finegoldii CAG:203]|nr:unknown [Bacteroides finegoldii CAG:203]
MEDLHQQGEEYEEHGDEQQGVVLYPVFVFGCHEGAVFQPFDEHEVDDGGGGDASEEGYAVLHLFSVVEGEYHTGNPLHKHSEEEGDGYGYEDCHDDGKGFVGVDEVAQREGVAVVHFDEREGEGSSK